MENINSDYEAELVALKSHNTSDASVKVIDTPETVQEQKAVTNNVTDEQLFGSTAQDHRIPELNQVFILEKSKQDKATELGKIAQEMYQTKTISRGAIISMETIAREILPAKEDSSNEVIVSDHEVNMYTEEPSSTEIQTATGATQAALDRITSELRTSAFKLGTTLNETGKAYLQSQSEVLEKSIAVFNNAVANFLVSINKDSLEDTGLKIKKNLTWANLMSVPLFTLTANYVDAINHCLPFEGTNADIFLDDLKEYFKENPVAFAVFAEFAMDSGTDTNITLKDLFKAFGSTRFEVFYTKLQNSYKVYLEEAQKNTNALKGVTDITEIKNLTAELHMNQMQMTDAQTKVAIIARLQFIVIKFLRSYN